MRALLVERSLRNLKGPSPIPIGLSQQYDHQYDHSAFNRMSADGRRSIPAQGRRTSLIQYFISFDIQFSEGGLLYSMSWSSRGPLTKHQFQSMIMTQTVN